MTARKLLKGIALAISAAALGLALAGPLTDKGTQPGLTYNLVSPTGGPAGGPMANRNCKSCHSGYVDAAGNAPWDTWAGTMMAQASRDPLFWAALDVANNDLPGVGDWCLRCHVSQGWLAGRSEPPGGSFDGCSMVGKLDEFDTSGGAVSNNDFEGVTCHLCHRMMENPSPPFGEQSAYFENGQYWLDDGDCGGVGYPCRRGPYDYSGPLNPAPHAWADSDYHDNDLCGNCHNVTHPVKNLIVAGVDQGIKFPIERTFKEWQESQYAPTGSTPTSCTDCHMKQATADPAYACMQQSNDHTGNMKTHMLVGGNAWIPDVIRGELPNLGLDAELIATRDAAISLLQNETATVEVTVAAFTAAGADIDASVKVTNHTGHKLPTGYPEGRRMWLNVVAVDTDSSTTIWESGAYDVATGLLTHDAQIKVYETQPGIWNHNGTNECDVVEPDGDKMFHFVLNDCIAKDNRIPPAGFTGGSNLELRPVGYTYPETSPGSGVLVHWDTTDYSIPVPPGTVGPIEVTATLNYQTSSRDYIEFLNREAVENAFADDCLERSWGYPGKSRGEYMMDLWNSYGKSAPIDVDDDSGQTALLASTPGEASADVPMLVTGFNPFTDEVSVTYGVACSATDHVGYSGPLSSVSSMTYTDQSCALGASGTASITLGAGNRYFVIVGNDGGAEGSYGQDSYGAERAEDAGLAGCNLPQDLSHSCDP